MLTIRALKETTNVDGKVKRFTSAQLITQHLASWKYARFEARIKTPKGAGFWPAFWMMPEANRYGGWPKDGEVDIMEMVTREPSVHIAVAHYYNYKVKDHRVRFFRRDHGRPLDEGFHTYRIDWTDNHMVWFIDGKPYFEASDWAHPPGAAPGAPFDAPFYLILNLSVGGNGAACQRRRQNSLAIFRSTTCGCTRTPRRSIRAPRRKHARARRSRRPSRQNRRKLHRPKRKSFRRFDTY